MKGMEENELSCLIDNIKKARDILKSVEWTYDKSLKYCPVCGCLKEYGGHAKDCRLIMFLTETDIYE